ncbi:helix-turn-helix domain-containing protein [Escherichia coli]
MTREDLMGIEEVCELLHCRQSTIYKLLRENELPKPLQIHGKNLWYRPDVEQWLKAKIESAK